MNFDAFSHGQIQSKIWLCEELEPHTPIHANIRILGSWYNILTFMLLTRRPEYYYNSIEGIDIDPDAIKTSYSITDAWRFDPPIVTNTVADANTLTYNNIDLVINCSPEHMIGDRWWQQIPWGTLVCIQTSNMIDPNDPWYIKTPHPSMESFREKYLLSRTLFAGTKRIQYVDWGYDRYMIIGFK